MNFSDLLGGFHKINVWISLSSNDLVLVSTAVQRLHLSEFDLYFEFASTFMSPDTFSSTGPK